MTLKEACLYGKAVLEEAGIAESALDAWYLLEYVTGVSRSHFLAWPEEAISQEQEARYREAVEKRANHIPLQHITGEQEFMGLTFQVNEHVLVPRQDTEVLVEETLKYLKPGMRFLDLCTGSGCILLSLLHFCPGAEGVGADVSPEALQIAEANRKSLLKTEAGQDVPVSQATLVESDLFAQVEESFELIVSNPPYIRSAEIRNLMEEVRLHDPLQALDGHEDGLYFYRNITAKSRAYLKPGGWLLFEIGYDQGAEVSGILSENGFCEIEVIKDLAGLDRVVKGKYPG